MNTDFRFNPGDQIVLRRVWNASIYRVTTATVVQDTSDLIALYWGPGYPIKSMQNLLQATSDPVETLSDGTWGSLNMLMLIPTNAAHAIYAIWGDRHTFEGWYINLQAPLRRTSVGFDTTDFILDILVNKDRTEWKWKDEADFDEAVAAGMISVEQANDIRSEGERAVKELLEGPSSFYESWENWHPSTEWPIPNYPEGWDEC